MHRSIANPSADADAQAAIASVTEEMLRTSLAMLQQVVDHLPQAIGWKDKNAVFLGCNQAFAQALGLSHPAEIVGKVASEMQWQNHPAAFLHDRDRLLIEKKTAEYHQLEVLPDCFRRDRSHFKHDRSYLKRQDGSAKHHRSCSERQPFCLQQFSVGWAVPTIVQKASVQGLWAMPTLQSVAYSYENGCKTRL